MFEDREDAGKRLAGELAHYKGKNALVLAIPRGGVQVAYQVAVYLNVPLELLVVCKLPTPHNPEAGFGAIAEDGSSFIFQDAEKWLSGTQIERIKKEQIQENKRRIQVLRGGKPLPELTEKTVILVDDGLAMGSTMHAAVMCCRKKGAGKIVVGVPVADERVAKQVGQIVEEIVVLEKPAFFRAVAQVYRNWYDVPDKEVLEIMGKVEDRR